MPTTLRALLLCLLLVTGGAAAEPAPPPHPLVWDAMEKVIDARPEDGVANFEFTATNTSDKPVEIVTVTPSCGCTVAEMPKRPWILAPGEKGSFTATVDFRGKSGQFSKSLFVASPAGSQMLRVTVNIPDTPEVERERNRQMASMDRQAVFRGNCASCHASPAAGKSGEQLFYAACAVCHLASPRASMVPDLFVAREHRDAAYWEKWIADGKEGTLMPGFAQRNHGPLSDAQIASLLEFALQRLPTEPPKN